jgi:site-specific recombinase XerD
MYKSLVHKFIESEGITQLSDITPQRAENYLAKRKARGLSQNSNATFMNALKNLLLFCNKRKHYYFEIEQFETPRRVKCKTNYVTPEEVNLMLQSLTRERDRLILLVLYTSGCRISELLQLSTENFIGNKFTVVAKGGKEHSYYIDPVVAERLRVYMQMECPTPGPAFRSSTGKPCQAAAVNHMLRKVVKLANISHSVSAHQFRHGFATSMLENGADVRTVQEMLGHEQIQTTMRYLHVTDSRKQESHEKFAPKVSIPDLSNLRSKTNFYTGLQP